MTADILVTNHYPGASYESPW